MSRVVFSDIDLIPDMGAVDALPGASLPPGPPSHPAGSQLPPSPEAAFCQYAPSPTEILPQPHPLLRGVL